MWLHFTRRPLKLVELQHALAVEKFHTELDTDNIPSRKALIDCCLGLVLVDQETLTVRFVHYTLEEYFRYNAMTEFPYGFNSIAETCLTYLNFGKLKQHSMNYESLRENMDNYAFLSYASLYWGTYVKQQCDRRLTKLATVILDHEIGYPPCAIQALYLQLDKSWCYGASLVQSAQRLGVYLLAPSPHTYSSPLWERPVAKKFSGIHATAYFGLSSHMEVFCKVGRYMELNDESNRTPLSWAAEYGHEPIVWMLIKLNDVNINSTDNYLKTPLSWAAEKGYEAVVRLLIERDDADTNFKDGDWRTPLARASENGHEAVVRLLMERDDVDISVNVRYGETPLSLAAMNGHEAVVRLLIARDDIDINSKDEDGWTPLSVATMNGCEGVVKLLIEANGVDINIKDRDGRTPLSWAAGNGHEAVVRLLIERGDIDINIQDDFLTPLSWAAMNGYGAVVQLLNAGVKSMHCRIDRRGKKELPREPLGVGAATEN